MIERNTASNPSLPLIEYAGTYTDSWYEDLVIDLEDEKLLIRFAQTPALVGLFEHYKYDTFIARGNDLEPHANAYITFDLRPDGSIE